MKYLGLFVALLMASFAFGQKYVVTPNGLRNADDTEKNYLVIEAKNMTGQQLYTNAVKFLHTKFKKPEEDAVQGNIEGEYLKFDIYENDFIYTKTLGSKVPFNARYRIELRFKDNKARFEIVNLEMIDAIEYKFHFLFQGRPFTDLYVIYKKNGSLYKEKEKLKIENYFNAIVNEMATHLQGKQNDDW